MSAQTPLAEPNPDPSVAAANGDHRAVRWGLVGTGGIARRTVGDLRLCDNAEVVAVASRRRETAEAFAAEWDLPLAFDGHARMCASSEVDAIYIGTPHSTHFAFAREALVAGKHVLCEKPLTMTAAEARELGRVAVEHGVFLMEAMWMKFSPALRRTVEIVESGRIGEIRHLQTGLGYPVPPDGPRRFWEAALGGGALFDMGVYQIALARMLLGDPVAITVTGDLRPDGVDLHESVTLEFASGATAQSITSITSLVPPRGWLSGTTGAITFNEPLFSPASITVTTGQPPAPPSTEVIEFAKEGAGYVPMFREVSRSILDGRLDHPTHPVSATVEVLQTMEQIRALLVKAGAAAATPTT